MMIYTDEEKQYQKHKAQLIENIADQIVENGTFIIRPYLGFSPAVTVASHFTVDTVNFTYEEYFEQNPPTPTDLKKLVVESLDYDRLQKSIKFSKELRDKKYD